MNDLDSYLYHNIPLTQALGITVHEATLQRVMLKAPLAPNINHKKTAFGGSLHAVATLACWSLVFVNLQEMDLPPMEIVIAASEIQYLMPIDSDFLAECSLPDESRWHAFKAALIKKGKGRVHLQAKIMQAGQLAVSYQGTFVAMRAK